MLSRQQIPGLSDVAVSPLMVVLENHSANNYSPITANVQTNGCDSIQSKAIGYTLSGTAMITTKS